MSSVTYTCPKCQRSLKGHEAMRGQVVKCPACQEQITLTVSSAGRVPPELPRVSSVSERVSADGMPASYSTLAGHRAKDLKPVVERNQTNGLSQAEGVRDRIYELFERAAADRQVEVLILKSPPLTSPPWVRVECWLRHPEDSSLTLRSAAEFTIRPREFYRFPVEIDVVLRNDKRRRAWPWLIEFDLSDAKNVLDYLMYERTSTRFGFRRRRWWPLQFWRPANKPDRLGLDPSSIAATLLIWVGIFTLWVGIGWILLVIGVVVAFLNSRRRRHVLNAGKPLQEPRELIRLDSWQTLVRGLGSEREAVISAIAQQLGEIKEEGFVVANERIWHWGVDGKEEREQLVARFRRAIAFVHVYDYGDDLFVGWDAHVNCGTWIEVLSGSGYDKKTSELCTIHAITPGWNVPTEYDITDANCLLERVHATVAKVVKLRAAEHHIDQEIDFRILREERQNIVGRKNPDTAAAVKGFFGRAFSKFQRIG